MKNIIKIGDRIKDDSRDLTITDIKYTRNKNGGRTYYKYKCNICGFDCGEHYSIKDKEYKKELWIYRGSLLSKRRTGCSCCGNQIVAEGINDIPTTAHWMVKYFQGGYYEARKYTKSSSKSIYAICPDCNKIKDSLIIIGSLYQTHSIGCTCGDGFSYPSKFMMSILEQLNVEFKIEYNPEWIKPKRYDFYIPSLNLIIETDGGLGHGNKVYPNSNRTKEDTLERDIYKENMANEHGIDVIRIDCKKSKLEYIKQNIINSNLNKIFDLALIDWNECDKSGVSNKEKYIYELFNKGYSREQISAETNIKISTVNTYIRKLNKINNKEYIKPTIGSHNDVEVGIFKDRKLLGIFPSYTELSRQSNELFGIELKKTGIYKACNNKCEFYKGFEFKKINNKK